MPELHAHFERELKGRRGLWGRFGGRREHQVAGTSRAEALIDNALSIQEDPEIAGLWQMAMGYGDLYGGDSREEAMQDLLRYLFVPDEETLHLVLTLAMATKGEWYAEILGDRAPRLPGAYSPSYTDAEYEMPRWLAEAVLADWLAGSKAKLHVLPISKATAQAFIEQHHSALPYLPKRQLYALGAFRGDRLVAVATAGHPGGRFARADNGRNVLELSRIASDGTTPGASSKLAAFMLDLAPKSKRGDPSKPWLFVTYSLGSEEGNTYLALADKGLRPVGLTQPRGKAGGARQGGTGSLREQRKVIWEAGPAAMPMRDLDPLLREARGVDRSLKVSAGKVQRGEIEMVFPDQFGHLIQGKGLQLEDAAEGWALASAIEDTWGDYGIDSTPAVRRSMLALAKRLRALKPERRAAPAPAKTPRQPTPASPPLYFASGSNEPGYIRGLDEAGQAIGVAAPYVTRPSLSELKRTSVPVFVDSGAFSEVDFKPGQGFVKVRDMDWDRVLGIYRDLAEALGEQLYVVAPDRVGDQNITLARMRQYAPQMQELAGLGANIIVPVQRGHLSMRAMWDAELAALGFLPGDPWLIAGVPSKKDATPLPELSRFLQGARPARVHYLGMGPKNDRWPRVLAGTRKIPGIQISHDSAVIPAMVGRASGPGGGPRKLTAAQDRARAQIRDQRFSSPEEADVDYTEMMQDLSWLPAKDRKRIAAEWGAPSGAKGFETWFTGPDGAPAYDDVLAVLVQRYEGRAGAEERKRRSIREVMAPRLNAPGHWLSVETIQAAARAAADCGISKVARSARGFVPAYVRAGTAGRLRKTQVPGTQRTWYVERNNFVQRHRAQLPEDRWPDGWDAERDEPTRRHLALAVWAWSPDPPRLRRWLGRQGYLE